MFHTRMISFDDAVRIAETLILESYPEDIFGPKHVGFPDNSSLPNSDMYSKTASSEEASLRIHPRMALPESSELQRRDSNSKCRLFHINFNSLDVSRALLDALLSLQDFYEFVAITATISPRPWRS